MNAQIKYHGTVIIDGAEIPGMNIVYVEVKEWIFDLLPRLKLIFNDMDGATELVPLSANSKIFVSMAANDQTNVQLVSVFNISDYQITECGNGHRVFVTGYMSPKRDGDPLWGIGSAAYRSLTSSIMMEQIITTCGYDFINDGLATGDTRDWLRLNENMYDFIHHLLQSAIGDGDLPLLYGTTDGVIHANSFGNLIGQKSITDLVYDPSYIIQDNVPPEFPIYYRALDLKNLNNTLHRRSTYGFQLSATDVVTGEELTNSTFPENGFGGALYHDNKYKGTPSAWDYIGIIDTGVVDINHVRSTYENRRLIDEKFSVSISVEMSPQQHVNIGKILNMTVMSVSDKNGNQPALNKYLSGQVMVSGITHSATPSIGYKKAMVVSRNGMGLE